jgi:hypothetical protein
MMQQRKRVRALAPEPEELRVDEPLEAEASPALVRLTAGADVQDLDLAGRTVGEGRAVAQAIFGIHADAQALVDGRDAGEEQVLAPGQRLEFTKRAGRKGAAAGTAAAGEPAERAVVEVCDDRVVWRRGTARLGEAALRDLLARVAATGEPPAGWRIYPRHVRCMASRQGGRIVGVVVEMPPGPRQVRWIADHALDPVDGPYESRLLSFPWVVLVLVFANGELSGLTQAFFRTAPLNGFGDDLYFTNLLNVAAGHQQESWVCMVNLGRRLGRLGWAERVHAVTEHFWQAAFNHSADLHEGNSFWAGAHRVDPRFASPAAWEAATAENPYFALQVRWRRAPHPLGPTLERMLDMAAPWRPVERVEQLVTLMQQGAQ